MHIKWMTLFYWIGLQPSLYYTRWYGTPPYLDIKLGTTIDIENQNVYSFYTLLSSIVFKSLK